MSRVTLNLDARQELLLVVNKGIDSSVIFSLSEGEGAWDSGAKIRLGESYGADEIKEYTVGSGLELRESGRELVWSFKSEDWEHKEEVLFDLFGLNPSGNVRDVKGRISVNEGF